MEKIRTAEKKLLKELDDQKISSMVKRRRDKLRELYMIWIKGRQKEFEEL